jgi:hypothetical protein
VVFPARVFHVKSRVSCGLIPLLDVVYSPSFITLAPPAEESNRIKWRLEVGIEEDQASCVPVATGGEDGALYQLGGERSKERGEWQQRLPSNRVIQHASASRVARVEVSGSGGRHFQISHSKTEYGPATSGTGSTAQRNGTGLGRESSWVSCPLTRVPLFG